VLCFVASSACGGGDNSGNGAGSGGAPNGVGGLAMMASGGATAASGGGGGGLAAMGSTATGPGSGGAAAATNGGGGLAMMGSGGTSGSAAMNVAGMDGSAMDSGAPTFSRVWSDVIVKKSCNSAFCHGMGQGMLLMRNKDDAYMHLVNVAAAGPKCGTSGLTRVVPGDPMHSLLFDKVSSSMPPCGDPMPIGTKFPPNCLANTPEVCNIDAEISLVRDWIAAGALND
jgi:hypothetical protein